MYLCHSASIASARWRARQPRPWRSTGGSRRRGAPRCTSSLGGFAFRMLRRVDFVRPTCCSAAQIPMVLELRGGFCPCVASTGLRVCVKTFALSANAAEQQQELGLALVSMSGFVICLPEPTSVRGRAQRLLTPTDIYADHSFALSLTLLLGMRAGFFTAVVLMAIAHRPIVRAWSAPHGASDKCVHATPMSTLELSPTSRFPSPTSRSSAPPPAR